MLTILMSTRRRRRLATCCQGGWIVRRGRRTKVLRRPPVRSPTGPVSPSTPPPRLSRRRPGGGGARTLTTRGSGAPPPSTSSPSPQAPTQPAQGDQIDGRHRPTFNLLDSLPLGKFLIIHVLPFPGLWQNSSNRFALTDVIVAGWVPKYCKCLRGNICKYLPPIPNTCICLDICDGLTSLLRTTLSPQSSE